jgi:hypothetical protein
MTTKFDPETAENSEEIEQYAPLSTVLVEELTLLDNLP